MSAPFPFLTLLEEAINRVLRLDAETLRRLGEIEGKCIHLRLAGGDVDREFYVFPSATGLRLLAAHDAEPDVTLRGEVPVFARLAFGGSGATHAGELQIGGDIELGQRFQRVLREIDIDWEEHASRLVGDVLAHRLGHVARRARAWQAQTAHTLGMDVSEYLQEESRVLPTRREVEAFLNAVDVLRARAERLEQRVARLRARGAA
jgi:ubiquinone biosynthesis protein UbiJ